MSRIRVAYIIKQISTVYPARDHLFCDQLTTHLYQNIVSQSRMCIKIHQLQSEISVDYVKKKLKDR